MKRDAYLQNKLWSALGNVNRHAYENWADAKVDWTNYREELIQVMAVAMAIVEAHDNGGLVI